LRYALKVEEKALRIEERGQKVAFNVTYFARNIPYSGSPVVPVLDLRAEL